MSEKRPTVLLADDHPMMLAGLRKLLAPDFEVVGTVTDGRALLAAAKLWRPALVITDISMPGMDGLEATRRLREIVPEARVLILSIHTESSWLRAAVEAGAWGYLPKTAAPEEIETAIREVLEGRPYFSPAVPRAVFAAPGEASGEALTPRELDIVRLVGKGLGNKEIAHALGVSVTTVRTHLNKVYDKLEPGSRVELALYAANAGETVM
jgi:DNA-binding NarL/FixJ family response regulator